MEPLLLLALAVGPALILLHAIYFADRYQKEPIRNLLRYLVAGAAMCVPAFFAEVAAQKTLGVDATIDIRAHPILFVVFVFVGVALVEEWVKRWMLWRLARRDEEIDEPFDWVVYSVTLSLGFATLENILYVYSFGAVVGVARAFTAVPSHALNATFMGDRLARAAVAKEAGAPASVVRRETWLSIVEPALWHGAYDACALGTASAAGAKDASLAAFLGIALLVLLGVQWILGILRVRSQQKISAQMHARGLTHRGGRLEPPILLGIGRLKR
jgi:RsiW-degrading membrane proteinase PrsW (M82 family)